MTLSCPCYSPACKSDSSVEVLAIKANHVMHNFCKNVPNFQHWPVAKKTRRKR